MLASRVACTGRDRCGSRRPRANFHAARRKPRGISCRHGRDETFYACTACHGFRLVAQQGMTRGQWEDSINLMVRRHNMPPLDDKDRDMVLELSKAAYPPRAPTGREAGVNPFAK